jgi:hypothetical protein
MLQNGSPSHHERPHSLQVVLQKYISEKKSSQKLGEK